MFDIRFCRDKATGHGTMAPDFKDSSALSSHRTVEEAFRSRVVSGDIVFTRGGEIVVCDPELLFKWEQTNEDAYIRKVFKVARAGHVPALFVE